MIHRATDADVAEIQGFLSSRAHQSMFPLSNLRTYGLDGGDAFAPSMWFRRDGVAISDVLTITRSGMVMPQCPTAPILDPLADRGLIGVIGPADQASALRRAAGLMDVPATLDRVEPHFLLNLADLKVPDVEGEVIPFADAPKDMMIDWQIRYDVEALGATYEDAKTRALDVYDRRIAQSSHMVLVRNGECVSKAGLNAQLPNIVQVGGVYTPPELRGQGLAKRVVALMLEQARARGVEQATLFAASDVAARAYIAIGFERVGDWNLTLFKGEQFARF